ncbi:MAG: TIM barrel protein [Victivallaceae bacterium]|nr:TIM barrel protein [Victivallaceae bacterium]
MVNVINEIDNPILGICFDAGHAHINQPLIRGKIAFCKEKLFHFHASDNFGIYDDHILPGTGKINWRDVFSDLKKITYNGTYLLEVVPNNKTYEDMGLAGDFTIIEVGRAFFRHMRIRPDL